MTTNALATEGMTRAVNAADPRVMLAIDAIERAIASGESVNGNDIRDQLATTQSKGLVGARVNSYANRKLGHGQGRLRAEQPRQHARQGDRGVAWGAG